MGHIGVDDRHVRPLANGDPLSVEDWSALCPVGGGTERLVVISDAVISTFETHRVMLTRCRHRPIKCWAGQVFGEDFHTATLVQVVMGGVGLVMLVCPSWGLLASVI